MDELDIEQQTKEPDIAIRDEFVVAGIHYFGPFESAAIRELWNEFDNSAIAAINGTSSSKFGVVSNFNVQAGMIDYLAGISVESATYVPGDLKKITIPQQTYAVFPCTIGTAEQAIRWIYRTWLPDSGFDRGDGPALERFGHTFDLDVPNSSYEYYLPVVRKRQ